MFSDQLEEFSQKYDYINEYFIELEKGLFDADMEILRKVGNWQLFKQNLFNALGF
jgi:hypothetical protein